MAFIFKYWERKMVSIKLNNTLNSDLINKVENAFKNHFSGTPFIYYEIANNVQASYKNELALLRLVIIFSGLAIFIAALGLTGLVVFYIEKNKKEISIIKVHGSSSKNLHGLLTQNIIFQVIIANLIVAPLIYFFDNQWLENFAFRKSFSLGFNTSFNWRNYVHFSRLNFAFDIEFFKIKSDQIFEK
jgi:putative ABC transport system permease protein